MFSSNLQHAKLQNFLPIRFNHSGLPGDTNKSKFLLYNFSRYNFKKLIRTLEEHVMHSKSNKTKIIINDEKDEVIKKLIKSLKNRYQNRLESMKGNEFCPQLC